MKVIAIRGKNLASLEGEFELDFMQEPLQSAGIFAITGHTGAGKSTLLDALCLALFDCTPRMNKAKENNILLSDVQDRSLSQNDSRSILRRGTSEGYSEVDFVALTGDTYRSRWSVRRSRGRVDGSLQKVEMTLTNLTSGIEEQGTKTELLARIADLVGLSFEQFNRSVLLAQGDFATFLKARQSEKAEILEKLTGTDIYSRISASIYEKTKLAENEYGRILERIKGVELLSEEQREQLSLEQSQLLLQLNALKKEEEEKGVKLKWIEEEQALTLGISQSENELKEVSERITTAAPRYNRLQRIEQVQEIRDTYMELSAIRKQTVEKQRNIVEQEEVLRKKEELLTAILKEEAINRESATAYKELLKRLEPEINAARELDVRMAEVKKQVAEATKEANDALFKAQNQDKLWRNSEQELIQCRTDKQRIDEWFEKYNSYAALVPETGLVVSLLTDMETTEGQRRFNQEMWEKNTASCEKENKRLNDLKAESEQLNLLLPTEIVSLRTQLQDGAPCPVCGSLHHPLKDRTDVQTLEEEKLNNAKAEVAKEIETLTAAINRRNEDIIRLKTLVEDYVRHMNATREKLATFVSILPSWEHLLETGQLKQSVLDFSRKWNEHLAGQTSMNEKITKLQAQQDSQQNEWKNSAAVYEERKQKKTTLIGVGEELLKERSALLGGKPTAEVIETHSRQLTGLEKKLSDSMERRHQLQVEREACKSIIDQQGKELKQLAIQEKEDQIRIDTWLLRHSDISSVEELAALLANDAEWLATERKELNGLKERETSLLAVHRERKKQWLQHQEKEVRPGEEEVKEVLLDQQTVCRNEIEIRSNRKIQIDLAFENHEKGKSRIVAFEKELEEKKSLYEDWAKLNELFGSQTGNKFKEIAQGYTLEVLLVYANKHLQDLAPRYELQRITDTLALQIADLDMMGEIRSVHSLSGGESFLVSLALALGLSSLSSNRMNVESLFIDEGFGALDVDTLRIAMDALERLQTQGRKIGVISHVSEMTERIPTQVQVVRLSSGKSQVRIVKNALK
ncbi:MAG TPA: ATP-dependent exonuclease [Bacteroides reticulotermitis]|nr:ATP-dependent exonuclease [Bacteroides reticulotermitis]